MLQTDLRPPAKGMKFRHARRTEYGAGGNQPALCTITSVSATTIFYNTALWRDRRFKMPRASWEKFCLEIVSDAPPPKPTVRGTLPASEAEPLLARAHAAGLAAGEAVQVAAMVVGSPTTPLGSDLDYSKPVEVVMDGVCGFAYINVPGDTPLGRYLAKQGWRRAYYGGMERGVHAFGQSLTRKEAYARAYSEVLREAGHRASYNSRMD